MPVNGARVLFFVRCMCACIKKGEDEALQENLLSVARSGLPRRGAQRGFYARRVLSSVLSLREGFACVVGSIPRCACVCV